MFHHLVLNRQSLRCSIYSRYHVWCVHDQLCVKVRACRCSCSLQTQSGHNMWYITLNYIKLTWKVSVNIWWRFHPKVKLLTRGDGIDRYSILNRSISDGNPILLIPVPSSHLLLSPVLYRLPYWRRQTHVGTQRGNGRRTSHVTVWLP